MMWYCGKTETVIVEYPLKTFLHCHRFTPIPHSLFFVFFQDLICFSGSVNFWIKNI